MHYTSDGKARPNRQDRPDISLPDGRTLTPRVRLADEIGVHERTLARGNHETVYVGGTAYMCRETTLLTIAKGLKKRCEPVTPRRKRTTTAKQLEA
jgi:hypothetical protein